MTTPTPAQVERARRITGNMHLLLDTNEHIHGCAGCELANVFAQALADEAERATKAERERCAAIASAKIVSGLQKYSVAQWNQACIEIDAAIRAGDAAARSETTKMAQLEHVCEICFQVHTPCCAGCPCHTGDA